MNKITERIEENIITFCKGFLLDPYLCYTEHGFHALFFHQYLLDLNPEERFGEISGFRYSVIQKEYPTHEPLGKSRRQHWDISIIDRMGKSTGKPNFDHLPLLAAIEFGLNANAEHLRDDIERLSRDSNVQRGFAVHLYRISDGISNRDRKTLRSVVKPETIQNALKNCSMEKEIVVFLGVANLRLPPTSTLWRISANGVVDLRKP